MDKLLSILLTVSLSSVALGCKGGGCGGGAGGGVGVGTGGGRVGGYRTGSAWSSSSSWHTVPSSSSYSSWSSQSQPGSSYTYYSGPSGYRRWWSGSNYANQPRYYVQNLDVGKGGGSSRVVERVVERPAVVERVVERPSVVERVVERPSVVERTVQRPYHRTQVVQRVDRPASGGSRTGSRTVSGGSRTASGGSRTASGGNVRRVHVQRPAPTRVTCSGTFDRAMDITGYKGEVVAQVNSCSEMVRRFPSVCQISGIRGNDCCTACRTVGTPNCLDQLSEANAITFSSTRRITSCEMLASSYPALCNTYGGHGGICCHSCASVLTALHSQRAEKGQASQVVVRERINEKGESVVVREETFQLEKGEAQPVNVVEIQNEKAAAASGLARGASVTCVDRIMGQMQSKGPGYTCAEYIALDACNCQNVGDDCCASCANVNLNEIDCRCRDTLSAAYPYYVYQQVPADLGNKAGGELRTETITVTSCDDLVTRFGEFCNQIGGQGQSCCKACAAPERQVSKCEDELSSQTSISLTTGGKIEDCRVLARDYKELCIEYGGENGLCCNSCQNVDTSCVDSALTWWLVDGKRLNCKEYINRNPCMCETLRDQCCDSCRNVDITKCGCRDLLSASRPYIVRVYQENRRQPVRKRVTSCARLARNYPDQCHNVGNVHGSCCRTCNRLGLICTDMLSPNEPLVLEDGSLITSCTILATDYQDMCIDYGRPGGLCCVACEEFLKRVDQNNAMENVEETHNVVSGHEDGNQVNVGTGHGQGHNVVTGHEESHQVNVATGHGQGHNVATGHEQTGHVRANNEHDVIRGHAERGDNLHEFSSKEDEFYVFKSPMEETVDMDMDKAISERGQIHISGQTIQLQSPEKRTQTHVTEEVNRGGQTLVNVQVPSGGVVREQVVESNIPSEGERREEVVYSQVEPVYQREEVYYAKGPDDASRVYEAVRHKGPVFQRAKVTEYRSGCVDRELGRMQSKGPGITCSEYITRDFCNCEEVGNECCASCANVNLDVDQCKCRDLLTSFYPFYVYPNGINNDVGRETITNCWDLVTRYPQFCAQIGAPGQSCCRACRQADIQHNCMDQLSDTNYLEYIPQGRITDCRILARDYSSLCKEHGGPNSVCCHSCQNVDLTCVNDALMYWEVDGQNLNCREYVHQDPCVCMTVKNSCCASCQNINLNRCKCRDYLSAEQTYIITHYNEQNEPTEEVVTDCDKIARYYQQFCADIGGEGQACCRTCRHIASMALTKG